MSYKVIIVKDGLPDEEKTFNNINEAFSHLGDLDFTTEVNECVLDDGIKILFYLQRDRDGRLSPIQR
jgi:hypothetical protein